MNLYLTVSAKVDILQWDRRDREEELRLSQAMASCSKQMFRDARTQSVEAANEEGERKRRHVSTSGWES